MIPQSWWGIESEPISNCNCSARLDMARPTRARSAPLRRLRTGEKRFTKTAMDVARERQEDIPNGTIDSVKQVRQGPDRPARKRTRCYDRGSRVGTINKYKGISARHRSRDAIGKRMGSHDRAHRHVYPVPRSREYVASPTEV